MISQWNGGYGHPTIGCSRMRPRGVLAESDGRSFWTYDLDGLVLLNISEKEVTMALINCSECGKGVSDKAMSCPNCGCPINQLIKQVKELKCPDLWDNYIGKPVDQMSLNTKVDGYFHKDENVFNGIPEGKVHLRIHEYGVKFYGSFYTELIEIHKSQLIDITETNENELVVKDKSVIGRAVVGTILLGPFGGLVGAISGVGSKTKSKYVSILVISFWDAKSREPISILIRSEKRIGSFVDRCKKDLNI